MSKIKQLMEMDLEYKDSGSSQMPYEQMLEYWKQEGIDPIPQYIVCAACKSGDTIIAGARHFDDIMYSQIQAIFGDNYIENEQAKIFIRLAEEGFIDQFGTFLTRKEAMNIATKNGQQINFERNRSRKKLYSEGLY